MDKLKVHFPIRAGIFQTTKGSVKAVDGTTFEVRRGETLGLVGESGWQRHDRADRDRLLPKAGRGQTASTAWIWPAQGR